MNKGFFELGGGNYECKAHIVANHREAILFPADDHGCNKQVQNMSNGGIVDLGGGNTNDVRNTSQGATLLDIEVPSPQTL